MRNRTTLVIFFYDTTQSDNHEIANFFFNFKRKSIVITEKISLSVPDVENPGLTAT